MKYRLYKFNGNLESFEYSSQNIEGWYDDLQRATKDFDRCCSMFEGQFVLVEKTKGGSSIILVNII
jgi:hypothetical protein